jgi:hypothetical protein
VDGSARVTELANEYGNNDIWLNPPFTDPITVYAQNALQGTPNEGNEGLFPITAPANSSGPWEWWDSTAVVNGCAALGIDQAGAFTRISNGYASNPVYLALGTVAGRARALAYIDTLQGFVTPRMYRALELNVGIDENSTIAQGVEVFPNPAKDRVTFTSTASAILSYEVFDVNGRLVRTAQVNNNTAVMDRQGLKAGAYSVQLRLKEGNVVRKLMLD